VWGGGRAARISGENQRLLAEDAARRARRERWTSNFLEFLSKRYLLAGQLYRAADQGDRKAFEDLVNREWHSVEPLNEVGWMVRRRFRQSPAVQELVTAERLFVEQLLVLLDQPTGSRAEANATLGRLQSACEAIFEEAEQFIESRQ
jgi:hypothetical protein